MLGEHGEVAERGVIKKIAVDPSTSDGVPRLAVDVALAHDTQPLRRQPRSAAGATPPPTRLPPPCGHPLPSVLLSPGLVRDVRRVEERPPRRRVHCTAEISRRPWHSDWASWSGPARHRQPAARPPPRSARRRQKQTARIGMLGAMLRSLRSFI